MTEIKRSLGKYKSKLWSTDNKPFVLVIINYALGINIDKMLFGLDFLQLHTGWYYKICTSMYMHIIALII